MPRLVVRNSSQLRVRRLGCSWSWSSVDSFTMAMPTDFEWSYTDEPHATRRKLILEKYVSEHDLLR